MTPDAVSHADARPAAAAPPSSRATWLLALLPLLLLAALLTWIVRSGPADSVRGANLPPVEKLAIERVTLGPEGIVVTALNDGPDPVTIAQVVVDDAFWAFRAEPGTTLAHLGRTTITIPYPWVHGEQHAVRLVTSTGLTFDHTIAVAVTTPVPTAATFGTLALIGVYVGVIPVAIGLLWYPLVGRLGKRGLDFVLALTIGLLAFLFVDTTSEALEAASRVPALVSGRGARRVRGGGCVSGNRSVRAVAARARQRGCKRRLGAGSSRCRRNRSPQFRRRPRDWRRLRAR